MTVETITQSAVQGSRVVEWLDDLSTTVWAETGSRAPDAFLRFAAFSILPDEIEDEDYEYNALCRLSGYGIEFLRNAIADMAETIASMEDSLAEIKGGDLFSNFNDAMLEYFGLYGGDVLRCYMASDKEPNVPRKEMNDWWLKEMLNDIPGFTAALQEASLAETGSNWWKRER